MKHYFGDIEGQKKLVPRGRPSLLTDDEAAAAQEMPSTYQLARFVPESCPNFRSSGPRNYNPILIQLDLYLHHLRPSPDISFLFSRTSHSFGALGNHLGVRRLVLVDEVAGAVAIMASGNILPIRFTELVQVRSHDEEYRAWLLMFMIN